MSEKRDFQPIFNRLKRILQKFETRLVVTANKPGNYYLNTLFSEKYKKEMFFGAVQFTNSDSSAVAGLLPPCPFTNSPKQ
jgi:hypothetical protein